MSHQVTAKTTVNGASPKPDPEVKPKSKRRTFTVGYKLSILAEADRCTEPGEVGALLRREGLYSSNLTAWRRQRDAGELARGAPKKRGRKPDKQAKRLAQLERENERLRTQLQQAGLIIGAQKKLAQALENALSDQKDAIL
jgi:transposase